MIPGTWRKGRSLPATAGLWELLACAFLCGALQAAESKPADDFYTNATEVRRFSFELNDDLDYDYQPDDWTRRRGPNFPHYVHCEIDRKVGSESRQSLRFDLNGGQAVYYSPLIRVDETHSYVLRGKIKTDGLQHDAAIISVSLLDRKRRRVGRALSRPVTGTHRDWVTVDVGPMLLDPSVQFLVVGCHIASGQKSDVRGQVWFDDLWLASLPRLVLSTSSGLHYFQAGEPIGIQTEVMGLAPGRRHQLMLFLEDSMGNVIETDTRSLDSVTPDKPQAAQEPDKPQAKPRSGYPWKPKQQENGFYRVRAKVEREGTYILEQETTFVVMDRIESQVQGEFGWSLSAGPGKLSLRDVAAVAAHAGVNWIKLPLWSASHAEQKSKSTEITEFIEILDQRNITLVGLLNDPPPQLTEKFAQHWVGVSKIFTMPRDFWYPSLEPLIARYSFRIRHWQLGDERDDSFVGLQSLPKTIAAVKQEFDRIGHDSRFGYHWDWNQPFPKPENARHSFLSLSSQKSLDFDQLQEALQGSDRAGIPRWVLLDPLPAGESTTDRRASDLARRVVAAKLGQAETIFISNPLDPQKGLLNANGSPTELFLPWRTLASVLRGTKHLGQFEMQERSPNAVFLRQAEALIVVWNDVPTREELYLGENITITDLWGRTRKAEVDSKTGRQVLEVGPMPIIVGGCSEGIARWRLGVRFEKGILKSEYGGHEEAILATNTFSQGISGSAQLHMPSDWEAEPNRWQFQAAVGEKLRLLTLITFPASAAQGKLRPHIDFDISADRPYKFTLYLPYQLGLGDVELQVNSRKAGEGRLEVEQKIINNTEPLEMLNFNCSLFIPGQVRQKQIVTKLGKGEDKRFYYILDAEKLRGQRLWLQAEQIDGRRVLNYHWKVPE